MGSLYGVATGRMELLEQILGLSAEVGLPFRFPQLGAGAGQDQRALDVNIPAETLQMLFKRVKAYIDSRGIVCPDYLIPPEYNDDNSKDYETMREYLFGFVETLPHGVTETFIHPCADTGEITAASHGGIRRVWEYKAFKDPKFQRHLADCGIKKISYRDLAKMRK
jgi:hypothetical protein